MWKCQIVSHYDQQNRNPNKKKLKNVAQYLWAAFDMHCGFKKPFIITKSFLEDLPSIPQPRITLEK